MQYTSTAQTAEQQSASSNVAPSPIPQTGPHLKLHVGGEESPGSVCLVLKIDGKQRTVTRAKLLDDEAFHAVQQACCETSEPITISLGYFLNRPAEVRVACLELIASIKNNYIVIVKDAEVSCDLLTALLSLPIAADDLDLYDRWKSALLEWAAYGIRRHWSVRVSRFTGECGSWACRADLRDLVRDARQIQRELAKFRRLPRRC